MAAPSVSDGAELVVEVVRNDVVESRHRVRAAVAGPDGALRRSYGDATGLVLPRSCNKPLQAAGLLRAGWQPPDQRALAVACASHNGEDVHVRTVRELLAAAGLDASALQNTPGWPLDEAAAAALVRAGTGPSRLHQNCSGKHAGMLVTARSNGWPLESYLAPEHPVQLALAAAVGQAAGEAVGAVVVDGCGAPQFGLSLAGLARAFGRLAGPGSQPELRAAADAMRAAPYLVAGRGRSVTELMGQLPGLVAKDGAEGMFAVGLPDGTGLAVKTADGAARACLPAVQWLLDGLGMHPGLALPVVLGHGRPVGEVRMAPGTPR